MRVILLSGMYVPTIASTPKRAIVTNRISLSPNFRNGLVVAAVAAVVLLPIVLSGIPNGADLPNHLRFVLPFYDSLLSGHFHPAWLAESNYGLGDLRFTVYPPGLYYLLSATRWLTGGWYTASISSLILLSIVGGLGAYFWASSVLNPKLAMWAGILYALAPYRLNEVYQASLLSEYAACSILPFAFAFVERICRKKGKYDVFGLAGAYGLLILTHLPLTVIGSLSLALYALVRVSEYARIQRDIGGSVRTRRYAFETLGRLSLGAILGLAASSFFWTSMVAELSWIKAHATAPNPYYDYHLNFLFSTVALTNRNTWYANVLAFVVIGSLLPGIFFIKRWIGNDKSGPGVRAAFVVLLATFLMATPLSRPVWAIVPKLSELQFPWRWLSVVSLMGALLVAASIPKWREQFEKLQPRDFAVGLAFALSLVFIGTQIIWDCEYIGRVKFETLAQELRGAVSFKDYLPVWAREFNNVAKMNERVESGSRQVIIKTWEPEHRSFHVDPGSETNLRVRTYFYPHWTARAEGRVLPTSATSDGLLQVSLPSQATDIELTFEQPNRVRVFEIVSLLSWALITGALLFGALKFPKLNRHADYQP
jgi:hypothetical protein